MLKFYYKVSLYDKQTETWKDDHRFPKFNYINCKNQRMAVAILLVYMFNNMEDNREYYTILHNNEIACKWALFTIDSDEYGRIKYDSVKLIYSCATEDFVDANRIQTLKRIFDVD